MSREIKFRGQTRRFGEKVNMGGDKLPGVWVYGGVCAGKGAHSIIYGAMHGENPVEKFVVYTSTIGQYTGLKDKNGVEIYEGDMLRVVDDEIKSIGVVKYDARIAAYIVNYQNGKCNAFLDYFIDKKEHPSLEYQIVGDIYDNPELLEAQI